MTGLTVYQLCHMRLRLLNLYNPRRPFYSNQDARHLQFFWQQIDAPLHNNYYCA